MEQKNYQPNEIFNLSNNDFIDFYYQTEQSVYQPFLDGSKQQNNKIKSKVLLMPLHQNCEVNCVFCSYRKDNSNESQTIDWDSIDKRFTWLGKKNINEVLFESGVVQDTDSLLNHLDEYQRQYPDIHFYLDLGSQTFLNKPNLLSQFTCFIDYYPLNNELRNDIEVFNKVNPYQHFLNGKNQILVNFLIDIPGQDFSDLVNDLLYLISLTEVKGIKICPFVPQENTPFSIFGEACFLTTLKTISICRLMRPDWDIFISPEIHNLGYEDTMKKAILYGGNKEIISSIELKVESNL